MSEEKIIRSDSFLFSLSCSEDYNVGPVYNDITSYIHYHSNKVWVHFFKTFIQKECDKLINIESKDFHTLIFQINASKSNPKM